MSAAAIPPVLREAASAVVRAFGAHPFHTDGDVLALAFDGKDGLWSVEDPGALRHWDVTLRQQRRWHALEEPASLWALHPGADLAAAGFDRVALRPFFVPQTRALPAPVAALLRIAQLLQQGPHAI